jgi:hypothetical protein
MDLNRFLSEEEFNKTYSHALDLGFDHLFVQFPEKSPGNKAPFSPFLPDFRRSEPFK